jgi:uncharacterized protein YceH (UPF0502 family)
MSEVIVQKLARKYSKSIDRAIAYYSFLSSFNNLKLQKREIELLAFTAIRGTITPLAAREEFAKQFSTTIDTIENLKGSLKKREFIIKDGKMYRVHPAICFDFEKPIILQIKLDI